MSILNIIFNTRVRARAHARSLTLIHTHILKWSCINGVDYSKRGYTLTIWQTKVWFLTDTTFQWLKWLPLLEWWYNTTLHTAIRTTPFEVVYGQTPHVHLPYLPWESSSVTVDRSLSAREEAIKLLKFHL